MALEVEDGTGKANAESFISLADAGTYHSDRGNAGWTGTDAAKEQALRRATEYMEQAYRMRWASFRTTATQLLSWPRAYVPMPDAPSGYGSFAAYVPNNVVPTEVRRACAELAMLALTQDLNPTIERLALKETVGPISVEYDPNEPPYRRYRRADMMLLPFLRGAGVSLVRA